MNISMILNRTEDGWQLKCFEARRDFHIRFEPEHMEPGEPWVLDEFDLTVDNNQDAHIESSMHKDMADALSEAFDRATDAIKTGK